MKTFSDTFSFTIGDLTCQVLLHQEEGVDRPTMNSKDNFVWMSNCSIGPPKSKNIFLKDKLVMLKHMISMTINNLKAVLKNGVYLQK